MDLLEHEEMIINVEPQGLPKEEISVELLPLSLNFGDSLEPIRNHLLGKLSGTRGETQSGARENFSTITNGIVQKLTILFPVLFGDDNILVPKHNIMLDEGSDGLETPVVTSKGRTRNMVNGALTLPSSTPELGHERAESVARDTAQPNSVSPNSKKGGELQILI